MNTWTNYERNFLGKLWILVNLILVQTMRENTDNHPMQNVRPQYKIYIFFVSQLVNKVTRGADGVTNDASHAMTCLSWSRCSCGIWWACSPGSSRPWQWRLHAGCYHDWRWPARLRWTKSGQSSVMPLARCSMRGGFEPRCYLHNLLVLGRRNKVT